MSSSSQAPGEGRRDDTPIRLAYRLTVLGRGSGGIVVPQTIDGGETLSDSDTKRMQPQLQALDQAIVRELRSGQTFGHLPDASLARVLPLLVQRQTRVDGSNLRIADHELSVRVRVEPSGGSQLLAALGLAQPDGSILDVRDGRLLAGSQAFFLRGNLAYPIASPSPWELARWAREPTMVLDVELSPQARDNLVRELTKVGVPAEDLVRLAVRREPPRRFIATIVAATTDAEPVIRVRIDADYGGELVLVEGQRPVSVHVVPTQPGAQGLVERDLVVEESARKLLRELGFRYDKNEHVFIAGGEQALHVLDPMGDAFPPGWDVVRDGAMPVFRRDLNVRARLQLLEDRGLIDVRLGIEQVRDATQPTHSDEQTVQALVSMKELLGWLASGKKYVQLSDGSFVAPSARFRRSLRLLEDLGATADRALVSPLCVGILRAIGDEASLAIADEATQAWLDELSASHAPPHIEPPASLAGVLRDYQARGLDWLAMLHRHRLTGILADDMGLGKTMQALALLMKVRETEGVKPSLVVAPTSVVTVWRDEAARFAPNLKTVLWHGPPKTRQAVDVATCDLVVTSYGVLRRDAELLANHSFRYVILDEAQSAKNSASQNARAIRRLKSERRLALTGTPVENRPDDLWAIFDFLAPGFLGSVRSFRKRYARPISRAEGDALSLLRTRVQPLVLRRLKSEVAKELPPKVESVVRCDMNPVQRALYDHVAGELRESVQKKIEQVGIERAHLDILAALTRLRQICCDPSLLPAPPGARVPPSAKLELFEELMREALDSSRTIVVFSQFVEMQKRLIDVVKRLGVDPLWLHGGTRNRDKVVASFQDPAGPPVIIVSLRAGGTGLTLTRADTVMHYDPWWNPAVEQQATDRTHRLGQQQQVTVYKLVCARSIEERVVELAKSKEALAKDLLSSEGGAIGKRITPDEVLALIG